MKCPLFVVLYLTICVKRQYYVQKQYPLTHIHGLQLDPPLKPGSAENKDKTQILKSSSN